MAGTRSGQHRSNGEDVNPRAIFAIGQGIGCKVTIGASLLVVILTVLKTALLVPPDFISSILTERTRGVDAGLSANSGNRSAKNCGNASHTGVDEITNGLVPDPPTRSQSSCRSLEGHCQHRINSARNHSSRSLLSPLVLVIVNVAVVRCSWSQSASLEVAPAKNARLPCSRH